MNEENDSRTSFFQYWKSTCKNALSKAWDRLGAWGTVAGVVTSIIAAILVRPPASWGDFWHVDAIVAIVILLAMFGIVLLIFIIREPVVIYNNQQNHIEELRPIRANIKITEQSHDNPHLAYGKGPIRFTVINHDPEDVTDCYAKLEFVYPVVNGAIWNLIPTEWHLKKLFWSSQTPQNGNITISGNNGRDLLDIIDVEDECINFLFQNNGRQSGFDSQEKELADGTYLFGLRLDGKVNGKSIIPIRKFYTLHFEQIYNVESLINPNVPHSNPLVQIREVQLQPEETKGTKVTDQGQLDDRDLGH